MTASLRCRRKRAEDWTYATWAVSWHGIPRCEAFLPGFRRPVRPFPLPPTDEHDVMLHCATGRERCEDCIRRQAGREYRAAMDTVPVGPCVYCGERGDTVDHVIPQAQGGPTTPDNLVRACRSCNQRKGNRTPEQWGVAPLPIPDEAVSA